jgi:ferredoxin
MRVVVDLNLCESNAVCQGYAPDVFELGEDDNLRLLRERPDPKDHDAIRQAVLGCPKQAISIIEEDGD